MTKQEGQTKLNDLVTAMKNQTKMDNFVNEGGDGYRSVAPSQNVMDYINTIEANGLFVTNSHTVIDADDYRAFIDAFNAAVRAAGPRITNVPAIEKKAGITRQELVEAKAIFG